MFPDFGPSCVLLSGSVIDCLIRSSERMPACRVGERGSTPLWGAKQRVNRWACTGPRFFARYAASW